MCSYIGPDSIAVFDWDEANTQHISRHQVEAAEVEEAFASRHLLLRSREGRMVLLGRSAAGRYLSIAFVIQDGVVRVITARSMSDAERKRFRRN
jgi:uncharacterized DUF497 family protein